jgi:hypothetical protein
MMKISLLRRGLLVVCFLAAASLSCQLLSDGGQKPIEILPSPVASAAPTDAPPMGTPPGEVAPLEPTPTNPPEPTATQGKPGGSAELDSGPCKKESCVRQGSFLLERPIGPDGRNTIVAAMRFGEFQPATKDAQIGVYFLNSKGTPVLAAADGEVIVAGDDSQRPYGPVKGMYGNLVILEHSLPGMTQPLYTLYGHLAKVLVEVGDEVTAGQQIGTVGSTGSATGSTLLFEVRLGENNPTQARNPELWLKTLQGEDGKDLGALAGQIVDSDGKLVHVPNIVLEQLAGPGLPPIDQFYLQTYSATRLRGLNPWEESFAIGDLPAGDYQISFMWDNSIHQQLVSIKPGKLTLVTINVE